MGTTINAANISIGLDVKKLQEGEALMRPAINNINASLRAGITDQEKYNQSMALLAIAKQKGAVDADRLAAAEVALAKKYGIVTDEMKRQRAEDELVAKLKAQRAASEKRFDDQLKESLAIRRSVMTEQERFNEKIRLYKGLLDQNRISQETYNRVLAQNPAVLAASRAALEAKTAAENRAKTVIESLKTAEQRHAEKIAYVKKLFKDGEIGVDQYTRAVKRYKDELNSASKKPAQSSITSAAMGFLPAIGIAGLVKESLKLSSTVESASAAFEVLTGSASKATEIVKQMKQLDKDSPLNFLDIQQAGKTLLGYGAVTDSVLPRLKQLGEIAMGDGERFKSLSLAFGQVTAAGRLTGQEVLQMVNNGFNPLQEISRNTGKSMVELKAEMEAGAISVKMVEDALTSATSAGGRFFGMNERLANTSAGAYAKMISDLQAVGVELGDNLMPLAKDLAATMREIAQSGSVDGGTSWIGTWSDGMRLYLAYLKDVTTGITTGTGLNGFKNMSAVLDSNREKIDELNRQKVITEIESEKAVTQEIANNEILAGIKDRIVATSGIIAAVADKQTAGIQRQIELARIQFDEFVEAETKRQKLIEQTRKANEDAAKKIIEDNLTPMEKFAKQLAEIRKLNEGGFLNEDQANRGMGDAARDFQKSRDNGVSATIAPALKAGSAEAYKFILDRKEDAQAAAERKQMIEIQKKQLIEQEKIAANLQPMKAIR